MEKIEKKFYTKTELITEFKVSPQKLQDILDELEIKPKQDPKDKRTQRISLEEFKKIETYLA